MDKHSPTLDSLRMIEDTLKQNNGVLSKTELWKKLPRKMMYQTYKQGIDYFVEIKKVILRGDKLFWISSVDITNTLISQGTLCSSK